MTTARYLRFAQALALLTVPACSSAAEPAVAEKEPAFHAAVAPTVATPTATLPASKVAPKAEETATSSAPSEEAGASTTTTAAPTEPAEPTQVASVDAGEATDAAVETNIPHSSGPIVPPRASAELRVLATLVPEPGATPIADEYRDLVKRLARGKARARYGTFARDAYDPRSVREAEARWRKRMVDEYASTTVFSGLMANLVEANATIDASAVVLRMAQDELRHAEVCGTVVTAMGGSPRTLRETIVRPLAVHAGVSAEERALRNVLVTSVSEMYSVSFFVASLDRMTDGYLRAVTKDLLADEVLHGRFGFYYLEAWSDWLAPRADVRASISRYLRYVFAVCEREFVGHDRGPGGADDDALGLVTSDLGREVFCETMAKAVAPGFERFGLDAVRAWERRSLE